MIFVVNELNSVEITEGNIMLDVLLTTLGTDERMRCSTPIVFKS